jgi:hypothetical protein
MSEQKMNITAIQQALETGLSTSVYEIYIPSLKKKVPFKPLLTGQCKTMAKIMIEANEKPFDTFKAVVAMIKATCMDETLDMNELTELDRVKIMLEFYMSNNILKDFELDCPKCGFRNIININIDAMVEKMEKISVDPIDFTNGQDNKLTCTVEIPKLPIVYMFYELVQNGVVDPDDIVCCFIKDFKLEFANKDIATIDIGLLDYEDLNEYISAIRLIPYIITVNNDLNRSVFDIIMEMLDSVMSSDGEKQVCTKCGADFGEVASASNFI